MDKFEKINPIYLKSILREIVNEIEDCILVYDKKGKLIYVNGQLEYLIGYNELELKRHTAIGRLETAYPKTLLEKVNTAMVQGRKFDTILHLTKKDGTAFYLAISITGVKNSDNKVEHYICIGKDITSAKMLHEKMHRIKYVDEVTGLPNQTAFIEMVYNKINREQEKPFSVILVDISKMSYINNTYGLSAGDVIIKEVGRRLQEAVSESGILIKLNSDIFAIIEQRENEPSTTQKCIQNIFKQVEKPICLDKGDIYIEISCGIALYPEHSDTAGDLINRAQLTLTKAKESHNKNSYMYYEGYMEEEIRRRILLESDMHSAYNNNEFIVYYQPFVDLNKQVLTGMEALLRRRKSSGEVIPPGHFIELLEQMELIELVGIRVVEDVCRQIRRWIDEGYEVVPVSINLSSAQFKNKNLANDIIGIVEKYDISTALIILEITETVVMEDVEGAQSLIRQLKEAGFVIAIDDFGTGYSSLGYLKKFLFDHLKIDISFVRGVVDNPQDRAIVAAIISIAKALKLKTVAEGIETLEQLQLMCDMGCEVGQGYLWDAPIAAESVEKKYLVKLYR